MKIAVVCPVGPLDRYGYQYFSESVLRNFFNFAARVYLCSTTRNRVHVDDILKQFPGLIFISDERTWFRKDANGEEVFDYCKIQDNMELAVTAARRDGMDLAIYMHINWYLPAANLPALKKCCRHMLWCRRPFEMLYRQHQLGNRLFHASVRVPYILNLQINHPYRFGVDWLEHKGTGEKLMIQGGDFRGKDHMAIVDCPLEMRLSDLETKMNFIRCYEDLKSGIHPPFNWEDTYFEYILKKFNARIMADEPVSDPTGIEILRETRPEFVSWMILEHCHNRARSVRLKKPRLEFREVKVDGRCYRIGVLRKVRQPFWAPRIIFPVYQPNAKARALLKVSLESVRRFTREPHELWVIDNNSPQNNTKWLLEEPGVNVVLNRAEPIPPQMRCRWFPWQNWPHQKNWGSYANGVGLEIGAQVIDRETGLIMTMHQDAMPCREGWLSYLQSKLTHAIAAAGVRMDKARTPEGVLHCLGMLVNFQIFKDLRLTFLPELPRYDTGDKVTTGLRAAGHGVFACPNTLWQKELVENIPSASLLRELAVDRSFDDDGNVIFLHLGRGILKSENAWPSGLGLDAWLEYAGLAVPVPENDRV